MNSFDQNKPTVPYPVNNAFIVLSIVFALLLNSLPWEGIWLMLRPDFVALVLLYWCMHRPYRIGIGLSWIVGVLADVTDASLFGQHALAYTVLAFCGVVLSRRLQMFGLYQQTAQVLGVFALTYLVFGLLNWQANGYVTWVYFLGSLSSTLLWIPVSLMFQAMQKRSADRQ